MSECSIIIDIITDREDFAVPKLPKEWEFDGSGWPLKKYHVTDYYYGSKETARAVYDLLCDFYKKSKDVYEFTIKLRDSDSKIAQQYKYIREE